MPRCATEVHEAPLGQEIDAAAIREGVFVDRTLVVRLDRLHINTRHIVQVINADLVVEVPDITDDGLVFHLRHMVGRNDAIIARSGYVNVAPSEGILDSENTVAFHRGLQCTDWIHFGHDNLCTHTFESRRAAFADITIATDHTHFAGNHHVCRTLDAVDQGLATAVKIIKL